MKTSQLVSSMIEIMELDSRNELLKDNENICERCKRSRVDCSYCILTSRSLIYIDELKELHKRLLTEELLDD